MSFKKNGKRGVENRKDRSLGSQQRYELRKALRAKFRSQYGNNWFDNAEVHAEYIALASSKGVAVQDMMKKLDKLEKFR